LDIETQNQQTVECEILTDSGQTLEDSIGQSDKNQQTVEGNVLTDIRLSVEDNFGHSDTEPTNSTV